MKSGDKVVCLSLKQAGIAASELTDPSTFTVIGAMPREGAVYVINKVYTINGRIEGLCLIGSSSVHKATGIETGYVARMFRKLDEIKAEARARQSESA